MTVTITEPTAEEWATWDAGTSRRLNIGCGAFPLRGFVNCDAIAGPGVDLVATVPPIPYADASIDDIYLGHVLEHYDYEGGQALLAECWRVLTPGGRLGVVVPDTREAITRWLRGDVDRIPLGTADGGVSWWPVADLDALCAVFFYSTVQPSHHQWSYDLATLRRAVARAGFTVTGTIDRYTDPRIVTGAWYQTGVDCIKPGA